jgi:hypothetical protein
MATWNGYARLARQLDDLYRDDERRAAEEAATREAATDAVAGLDHRLGVQRHRLERLSELLHEPLSPPPIGFTPATDPVQALGLVRQHTDLADTQIAEVERMAQQPPLLPGSSPLTRNLAVYGACSVVAVVVLYALLAVSGVTHLGTATLLGAMCALPLLAWIGGYVATGVLGRPRIGDADVPRNPRLGLLVCFVVMPLAVCGFVALI